MLEFSQPCLSTMTDTESAARTAQRRILLRLPAAGDYETSIDNSYRKSDQVQINLNPIGTFARALAMWMV